MILQALAEYYERKSSDPNAGLARIGFENKEIPFVIELSQFGDFIQLEDTRETVGKRKIARSFIVPQTKKRSGSKSYEKPNLLWDHYGFVLGYAKREGKEEPLDKDIRAANLQHQHFIDLVENVFEEIKDNQVKAVLTFLRNGDYAKLLDSPQWVECANIKGCNLAFRIQGDRNLVCHSPNVIKYVEGLSADKGGASEHIGICLVTGNKEPIERLHPSIAGVGQKPAPLAAINDGSLPSFSSFGKHQGFNFPVGEEATFAYATALNHLLRKGSPQRMQVGDSSTVFWAAKKNDMETRVVSIFAQPEKDDSDRNILAVQELFKSIQNGRYAGDDKDTSFYVLGLAPNAARIAVRFWHVGTVAEMAERIVQHFSDLKIVHSLNDPPFLPLFRLLVSTASLGKPENIPPNLAGDVMRSILEGLPYPQTLLGAAIRRIKAEQSKKDKNTNKLLPNVTYSRAALIKACINRSTRYSNSENKEELKVALDEQNTNIGYRLGRLFAVLEKIQEDSVRPRKLNTTIRDSSYGSASSTPVVVFSRLMRLSNHHLSKIKKGEYPGAAVVREKEITSIMNAIDNFPAHLPIFDQGCFAIGYYHQRQTFFTKSETKEINDE